jgi:hypothetical protein
MVNEVKLNRGHDFVKLFLEVVNSKSWQEGTSVVNSLNKGVNGITIGLDTCNNDRTVLVLENLWSSDTLRSSLDCFIVDASSIINKESDVLNAITVLLQLSSEFLFSWVQR